MWNWGNKKQKDITPPPSNDGRWEQRKEDMLAKFQNDGRYTIERAYIMRRVEGQKKQKLSIQISKLQFRSAVQVITCAMQNLPEQDQMDVLNGWETTVFMMIAANLQSQA